MRHFRHCHALATASIATWAWASPAGAQSQCGEPTAYNGVCFQANVNAFEAIQATSNGGTAVVAVDQDTSGGYAVAAQNSSAEATAQVTNYHTTSSDCTYDDCSAVHGSSTYGYGAFGASSNNYGVFGTSDIGSGPASGYGLAGVYGYTSSSTQNGVLGVGGTGVSGIGVANGVYGDCTGASCYAGYFEKDVYINGTTYPPSDRRLKKNIVPLSGAIDQLLSLHGVNFEWKEPEKHNDATGKQIGFVAQDVEQVFPNWVKTSEDGFKALSVAQIEGLEVESIRTLKMQNDALSERVKELEGGHRPVVSGFDGNGLGFAVGGLAIAGAILVTQRRKRVEAKAL